MNTNTEISKYITERKVRSSAISAESTSIVPDAIIPVMEIDWELREGESDYIDKEEMKRTYDKLAGLDKHLANVGLEEYNEGLEKIDSQ